MLRKATVEDLEEIYSIYNSLSLKRENLQLLDYQADVQKEGFLLGLETKENYENLIREAFEFLIYEENNEILGYVVADHRDKFIDDEYKKWFNVDNKDIYYKSADAMTVSILAIKKDKARKGIATMLLDELSNILRGEKIKHLYSIITISPVTNCPSILFHAERGFKRIAMGIPRKLFDLDNYSAILFYKELK